MTLKYIAVMNPKFIMSEHTGQPGQHLIFKLS